jgi:trehalose 2-sulfotransferase
VTANRLSIFVCGTPRAGTSLLTGLVKSTNVAGRPEEYFWRFELPSRKARWNLASSAEHIAAAIRAGTTANGIFGAKLMWGYFGDFIEQLRAAGGRGSEYELIESFFANPRFVFIRRDDIVAQAVSWAKAIQTGIWYDHVHPGPGDPASFDFEQIDALAREARDHNDAWTRWFAANDIDVAEVVYEELSAAPATTARAVLEFLGIEASEDLVIEAQTRRQADQLNQAWVDEYLRRFSARAPRATGSG